MKYCPECKREYEDDSLRFCLEDGTRLTREDVSPTIAGPTMVLPANEAGPTTISRVARPNVPAPSAPAETRAHIDAPVGQVLPASLSALPVRIVVGILFVISLILTIIGWATWGAYTVRRLPLVLLFISVIVLAIVRAPRHPKVSLLVGLALCFDLIETFVYMTFFRNLSSFQSFQTINTVITVCDDISLAIILVLLTMAVLAGRKISPANFLEENQHEYT
jgi:hypothetical protein